MTSPRFQPRPYPVRPGGPCRLPYHAHRGVLSRGGSQAAARRGGRCEVDRSKRSAARPKVRVLPRPPRSQAGRPGILLWPIVQVLFPAPSALTAGAAGGLVRNDGSAFLYAKPGPMPPLSPIFRRNTRLGLQHGPGSIRELSDLVTLGFDFP